MQGYNNEGILTRNDDIRKNTEGYNDPTPYTAIINYENGVAAYAYPRRGCVYQLDDKMALVISDNANNEHSTCVNIVFVFPWSIMKPLPTHVALGERSARCEKITSYKRERLGDFLFQLSVEEMAAVEDAIRLALDLPKFDRHEPVMCVNPEPPATMDSLSKGLKPIASSDEKLFAMTIERNMYRKLYEQLLNRVVEGKAQ